VTGGEWLEEVSLGQDQTLVGCDVHFTDNTGGLTPEPLHDPRSYPQIL